MLMWELALFLFNIWFLVSVPIGIFLIDWDNDSGIGCLIATLMVCTYIFGIVGFIWNIVRMGVITGFWHWLAYCWNDFWTREIDPNLIIISLPIISTIVGTILGLYKLRKMLEKPVCSKCNTTLNRKQVYCHNCGKEVRA